MNVVDYVIIGVVAVSVLFGLYRGFVASVLNVGGGLISFLSSFALYPKLAELIRNNEGLRQKLLHYTDASSRIGDLNLAIADAASLGRDGIERVMQNVNLPAPLDSILRTNLESLMNGSQEIAGNVGDFVSQTIVSASINIISFVVCFLGLYILISVGLNLIRAVFRFPVLKQLDQLAGGVFGLLRGILLCLVVFTLMPLVQTVVPMDAISTLLEESTLAPVFMNGNLVTAIMNRQLF